MEFDQLLFKKVSNFISRVKNKPSEAEVKRTIHLGDQRNELTILAQALTGKPLKIITAEREGGWKDDLFLLPGKFSLLPTKALNEQLYWFRIFYLSTLVNHQDKFQSLPVTDIIDKNNTTNQQILETLFNEFPAVEPLYHMLLEQFKWLAEEGKNDVDYSWLFGKWLRHSAAFTHQPKDHSALNGKHALPKPNTELKAKPVDEITSIQVDKKAQEDYTLMHNFEKVETAEEFNGTWRDFDGDDDLKEHAEALEQITLKNTVRVDDETHSVYQCEFIANAQIPESRSLPSKDKIQCFTYDEWNYKTTSYRKDYCAVYPEPIKVMDHDYIQKAIKENGILLRALRKQFASFFNQLLTVKHLNQGEELDIDALTDLVADQKAGNTPNDKVYNSKRKRKKDLSVLFLLDLSLSSDGYTGGNRIIDIEKQVVILMGELLHEFQIDFQIDGFWSKTRNHCSYMNLKQFEGNWHIAKGAIGGIAPEGYTRIGPALRHAKTQMEKQDSRAKWIVILSDGKPNDYDKYEGKYGIADVRQALRELDEQHIHVHTFAIEEKAKFYLPQIFGKANYNVLSNPKEMLMSMSDFCQKILVK
ncbi:VWA domain-containing protein [Fulvivirgaceae bacterium BMA10]|uniref:VWA domain-containing protein n=1 Tax=Splendidivirga corallicola TaxID=3051826 RepID=A0ABT8KGA6_9BACT|nr:VWA domain-containing protein [Fulvivirgaceae bacterium BMA10]